MSPTARNITNPDQVPIDWHAGDVFLGIYEVRAKVGEGGMGKVYRVRHRGWNLDLAVKCPTSGLLGKRGGAKRFEEECEMWINLPPHPNVVTCYYVRRLGGLPRVFAEYIAGGTLWQWIHKGHLYKGEGNIVLRRIINVAIQFARGLEFAHNQGLVHQDVKTMNVLMTRDGRALVTDFGLASAIAAASDETASLNAVVARVGTPHYRAPEQSRCEPAAPQADLYGWAACIMEMFIGDVSWMAGQNLHEVLSGYQEMGPDRVDIPLMPERLYRLLHRCLEPDAAKRPKDMNEVIQELENTYAEAAGKPFRQSEVSATMITSAKLNNRAVSLLDLGRKEEALRLWDEALQIEPAHMESIYNRALFRWRTGYATDQSFVKELRQLKKILPNEDLPSLFVAYGELERGDYEAANEMLEDLSEETLHGVQIEHLRKMTRERVRGSRRVLRSINAHSGEVTAVCLSWDARLALSASLDKSGRGELKLWDLHSGKCVHQFPGHAGRIDAVAFSADGLFALSGGADGVLRLWSILSGSLEQSFTGHDSAVTSIAFPGDGRHILSGGVDGTLRLWNMYGGECERVFEGHKGPVMSICSIGTGRQCLTGGAGGAIRLWEVQSGKCIRIIDAHAAPVTAINMRDDARYIISGAANGHIRIWRTKDGECLFQQRAHQGAAKSVYMSKDRRVALSASPDGKMRLWEVEKSRCIFTFAAQAPVSLNGDGRYALSGDSEGKLHLWFVALNAHIYFAPMFICHAIEE